MSQSIHIACAGQYVNTPAYGTIIDSNSSITYVLHDGQFALGNIYAYSTTGTFANNGSLPTNIDLFISAVVGPFINGVPDFLNSCTDVALPGTPVRFLDPIEIETNYICNNATGMFTVNFIITGGGPSYSASGSGYYSVSGDWNGVATPGVNYSITALQDNSIAYILVEDDGKGCSTSATVGPIQCIKLPIELLSCDGEAEQDGNRLKWVTASEIENDYFTIERATEYNSNKFEYLATLKGAGTTGDLQTYTYIDRTAPSGINYYRISQTDFDGTTEVICTTELRRGEQPLTISGIIPNPAVHQIEVYITNENQQDIEITIIDALGQILQQDIILSENIFIQQKINIADYARGIYFVRFE